MLHERREMIRKKTIHRRLLELGFKLLDTSHRHKFYSRIEKSGTRIDVSVYRTTLFMTHVYISTRTSDGVKISSRFANLTDKTSLSVIDKAISAEEMLIV